jgi:hypothetical protein
MASEIEQKMMPCFFSSSLKVVTTETESNTASTATLPLAYSPTPSSSLFSCFLQPARISCSFRGILSLA